MRRLKHNTHDKNVIYSSLVSVALTLNTEVENKPLTLFTKLTGQSISVKTLDAITSRGCSSPVRGKEVKGS